METRSARKWKENVLDESETDEAVPQLRYDITSFGADYDVDGLVKRMKKQEILIPPFQRGFVWSIKEASRFLESLLLGLPVPGIFLAKEPGSNKFLVIDGQQRLKTMQFFYEGYFHPKPQDETQKVFKLVNVQKQYEGRTYATLDEKDRLQLDNSIIHATIIKQESPPGENTSIFHVFERLNTGGMKLAPQEVRVATYHGLLMDTLKALNEDRNWRSVYGKPSPRLKDQELILRFLGMYLEGKVYQKPMSEFLSKFAGRQRNPPADSLKKWTETFSLTIKTAVDHLGERVFRPERSLNAAVFDSVMVGLARRLSAGPLKVPKQLKPAYEKLLKEPKYFAAITRATSDEQSVSKRLEEATSAFAALE